MDGMATFVSPEYFMDNLVPQSAMKAPPELSDVFSDFKIGSTERHMCDVLVETFSASAPTLCPDFRFTATSAGRSRGVICGLYPSAHVPTTNANVAEQLHAWPEAISKLDARRDAKGVNADGDDWGDASACTTVPLESQAKLQVCVEQEYPLADWSWLELAVVAQARTDMDPFNYQNPDGALGESVLGRIQACAQSVFDYQQRTHQYMVLIFADTARLVYIDRAGMVVTTAFKYATDGDALVKFLWCFARMSPADRGHDPTAERLDPDSAESQKMRERASRYSGPDDYVTQLFKDSLVPDWPWYSLSLWDENDAERKERRFLVGKPHVTTGGLVGQATQGYVALDRDDPYGRLLYLKDTWRALHPDIAKEGATLKFLVENHVRHIPTVECHGDLCQSTVSQECRLAHGFDLSVDVCPIKRLEHCRLVVKEVGMPLETFKSAYDLLIALTCCLRAHADAYKLGILHNGISPGNILLVPDPEEPGEWIGMLHGWGSAKKTTQTIPVARQPDRTGTWQFMSARALDEPGKPMAIQDELESVFHVLLYMAIRFLPHNCPREVVGRLLDDFFDDAREVIAEGRCRCGVLMYYAMNSGTIYVIEEVSVEQLTFYMSESFTAGHPLNEVVMTLLSWFQAYYAVSKKRLAHPTQLGGIPPTISRKRARNFVTDDFTPEDTTTLGPAAVSTSSSALLVAVSSTVSNEERLAENLKDHGAMIKLFMSSLRTSVWPSGEDKTEDKRPTKEYDLHSDEESDCDRWDVAPFVV